MCLDKSVIFMIYILWNIFYDDKEASENKTAEKSKEYFIAFYTEGFPKKGSLSLRIFMKSRVIFSKPFWILYICITCISMLTQGKKVLSPSLFCNIAFPDLIKTLYELYQGVNCSSNEVWPQRSLKITLSFRIKLLPLYLFGSKSAIICLVIIKSTKVCDEISNVKAENLSITNLIIRLQN